VNWWRVDIELEEPFSASSRNVVTNEISTEDFIPSTTLRGALSAALAREGRDSEQEEWFGIGGPLYSNAFPVEDSCLAIPMPLCFVRDKGELSGFEGQYGVANTLFCGVRALPSSLCGHRMQWTRLSESWLKVDTDGGLVNVFRQDTETLMHVALHYGKQSVRGSALFSREQVCAGSVFRAWVKDGQNVLNVLPERLTLGKRRSSGSGLARLRWSRADGISWTQHRPANGKTHTVQLLSDALLPCSRTGGWKRAVEAEDLAVLFKDPAIQRAESDFSHVSGYSSKWGLPKPAVPAVRAGSVYLVEAENLRVPDPVAQIGVRTHEGFGWVAINPKWLTEGEDGARIRRSRSTSPEAWMTPLSWPGTEHIPRGEIRDLLGQATTLAKEISGDRNRLQAILTFAQRASTTQEWLNYLERYQHLDQWKNILKHIQPAGNLSDLARVRFLLEMTLIRLPKKEQ
jgi:hypothetical protein